MEIDVEVLLTQRTFRLLLDAASHPGRVFNLEAIENFLSTYNSYRINNALLSIILTLLDNEVGFCVCGKDKDYLESIIFEITRCKLRNIEEADFIIFSDGKSHGEIFKVKNGTLLYPETGATVIFIGYALSNEDDGKGTKIILKGPGIENEEYLFVEGINKEVFNHLKEINSQYPLGIDAILIDKQNRISYIPRTTKIEVK